MPSKPVRSFLKTSAVILTMVMVSFVVWKQRMKSASAPADHLVVAAASSLSDVLRDITAATSSEHPSPKISLSFGASSTLAQQVKAGAPIDVIISADAKTLDSLKGEIITDTRIPIAQGQLALIVPTETQYDFIHQLSDLAAPSVVRIAVCDGAVPVGFYMQNLLAQSPKPLVRQLTTKFIKVEHARAAVAAVRSGAVDAAFAYVTDVAPGDPLVRTAATFDRELTSPVIYEAAVVRSTAREADARAWITTLRSEAAAGFFRAARFQPVDGSQVVRKSSEATSGH